LPAGNFSSWLDRLEKAMANGEAMDVPCKDCTACCTSSYFIHIGRRESRTIHAIPSKLLFPATNMAKGDLLMGYDAHGCCPMFLHDACSIYENRPLTCRQYDCRIFAAAGIDAGDGKDKILITERSRQWEFAYPSENDLLQHNAVKTAARFLAGHPDLNPKRLIPANATQLALLAIKLHTVFLDKNKPLNEIKDALSQILQHA
jgi:uncharacterized protein